MQNQISVFFVRNCVLSKVYRLYQNSDNKFIVRRDVTFLLNINCKSKRAEPNLNIDFTKEEEDNDINNSGEVNESELSDVSKSSKSDYDTPDESEADDQRNNKCAVRRSELIANKATGSLLLSVVSDADDPVSLEEALNSAEAADWKLAMEEEIDSQLLSNSKLGFKTKRNAEGALVRYKTCGHKGEIYTREAAR